MHPQLQAVLEEFAAAHARLHALATACPDEWWAHRPDPARWSIGECVAHLNLTGEVFLPLLRRGLDDARRARAGGSARYRRDIVGWLLWRTAGPPARFKARTTATFVPSGGEPRTQTVATFDRLQQEQMARVRDADGLPLGRVRIVSPFDPRLRYNLYACFTILPRHQHRHLWQAEQVLEGLRGGK